MAVGTAVTVQNASLFGGDTISFAAVDGTNGNTIPPEPGIIVIVKVGATATVVTMESVADPEYQRVSDVVSSSVSNADLYFQPQKIAGFKQKTGDNAGKVHFTFSQGTNVTIAAIRPAKAG